MTTRLTELTIVAVVMAFGILSGCARAPVINVEETISVSDSPQMPSAPAINIVETIGVGDSPMTTRPTGIELSEAVEVTDFPRLITSIALSIIETVRASDSPILTPIQVQPSPPPPTPLQVTVTVASPKAGTIWLTGTTQSLSWTTTGEGISYVGIYYSLDGGKSMYAIAQKEYNDGNYLWVVPNTPSKTVLVRVLAYDANGGTLALGDSGLFIISIQ